MAGRRIDPTRYTDPSFVTRIAEQAQLAWRLLNDKRVPTALKIAVPALAVAYAVSPVDLIPDFLLGVGQLDDIGIILAALALFVRLAPRHVVAEHTRTTEVTADAEPAAPSAVADDWWRGSPQPQPTKSKTIDVDYVVDGRRSS